MEPEDHARRWVEQTKQRYAHIPILSIEELAKLPAPQEYDAGVYFLWKDGGLIYIGKSKHICERLYIQGCMNRCGTLYHGTRYKSIPWDAVTCIVLQTGWECPPWLSGRLTEYERAYIAAYEPLLNEDFRDGFT